MATLEEVYEDNVRDLDTLIGNVLSSSRGKDCAEVYVGVLELFMERLGEEIDAVAHAPDLTS